ncbi:uncharacterized protein [Argopecten irradians]|uniref:uncharacterized protein isoform X2 n=1 Tax=Argopecten irradians TaxID=31199 RepID=UPI003721E024
MASHPSAAPPTYEEVVNSGAYYNTATSNLQNEELPPPYVYDNFVSDNNLPSVDTPYVSQGSSTGGAGARIFVVPPPSAPTDPIPPKPSTPATSPTPRPAANRTPDNNSTPVPNSRPQPNTQRARRLSFSDKSVLREFFKQMYLILAIQMGSGLALGAGIYSSGILFAAIFFTWTMTDIRKKNKIAAFIFLIIFTLILSYGIMTVACTSRSTIVLVWAGITCAHSIIIQIFILQQKIAFTLINGMISTFVTVVGLTGITCSFLDPTECALGGVIALVFNWWVIIFIWCMVDDRKKYNHKPTEAPALQPFLFGGILWFPLILLGILFCKFEWSKYK